jgi:hypothetical protein
MFKLVERSAIGPSYVRSALQMNSKAKIRLDSIETAHRALDALPEHRPEELTKTQAIQRLIVPIRATQSKGYTLAAIGKVLSECGIPITTGALRAYVSEASAASGKKKARPAKPAAQVSQGAQAAARKSIHGTSPMPPAADAAKPNIAAATSAVDLDWDPAARSEKMASSSPPRGSFSVRPDTKDL